MDAISDKNLLRFRIDYVNTVKVGIVTDKQVSLIDAGKALLTPELISQIVAYPLKHFDQKTESSQY